MEKKTKLIIGGAVVGVLAVVFLAMHFFGGSEPPVPKDLQDQAAKAAAEAPLPAPEQPVAPAKPKGMGG